MNVFHFALGRRKERDLVFICKPFQQIEGSNVATRIERIGELLRDKKDLHFAAAVSWIETSSCFAPAASVLYRSAYFKAMLCAENSFLTSACPARAIESLWRGFLSSAVSLSVRPTWSST